MDPMPEEQLDYEEEEYGAPQKMQYHGGGAISALAEDENIGEDDEYDDLYNDVNVGDGFLQFQRSEASAPSAGGAVNGGFQTQKTTVPEPRQENPLPKEVNIHGAPNDGKFTNSGVPFTDPKERLITDMVPNVGGNNTSQKAMPPGSIHDAQASNMGFRGPTPVAQNTGIDPADMSGKVTNEPQPLLNPNTGVPRGVSQVPANHSNVNVNLNRQIANDNPVRPAGDNGATMLFVGELHWWTTDAEIESVSSQYGPVKEIKFFDEKASGKSKGYCQVEFYDSAAAAACKEGMNGYVFNGRPCVVAFASPQTIKQMGASYMNKSQVQPQSQQQGRRPMNENAGRGGGTNYPSGDSGRGYGRGGWGRGQGVGNRGGGHMRGMGGSMGPKNMPNAPGVGAGGNAGGYGQGMGGPAFGGPPGGFMHPQGMMGGGFDPTYMGRGSGYGGFPGPAFPGMMPPFPNVNAMGIAGVSPHVNPAFFGRGMAGNGMGMMGNAGMDGPHQGMWNDNNMGGWGGEEHGQRTRESSYVGEDGGSEYGYGDQGNDKGARSNAASREKERGSERDWSGNSEKRHRDERDPERDRYDRDHRYREEKDDYREHRQKDRDSYKDDGDRGQASSRSRSRSRVAPEDDHRSRSRDADYGKRRRLPSD
ncbi:uncharacterized protein LOC141671811 [Apium graveolens]|uniref:uncharacterized protein LOC141671811 n=1 Tax=Apium graveolens TaxID=4045 RepID=UPI003D799E85